MSSRSSRSSRRTAAKTSSNGYLDDDALDIGDANDDNDDDDYLPDNQLAVRGLSKRLGKFRKWLKDDANVTLHPAVCIVNGEATDGTRNAPVLIVESDNGIKTESDSGDGNKRGEQQRLGAVDKTRDQSMYQDNMGCEVRVTREVKEGEQLLSMPRTAMVTPDVVAASDAGRAVRACMSSSGTGNNSGDAIGFWDVFENTTQLQSQYEPRISGQNGAQLLVKILQERKKVEAAYRKRSDQSMDGNNGDTAMTTPPVMADAKSVSTRAVVLAFLVQQRFASNRGAFMHDNDSDASNGANYNVRRLLEWPQSFAPYVHTLPSFVPLPLCWQRNELALLSSCLPGLSIIQDVATNTMLLATEFTNLLNAGILERFPEVFPPGCLTWDRWLWAAAVHTSRVLPATSYFNDGDADAYAFKPRHKLEFQSPPAVWQELGVMIPFLDMLNHEVDTHQVTWKAAKEAEAKPGAVTHKRIRKDDQLYCCYGLYNNTRLLQQYGFTQLNNRIDSVNIGWWLSDAVYVATPPQLYNHSILSKGVVYHSADTDVTNKWWTDVRLSLLKREAASGAGDSFIDNLKAGKPMMTVALNDGNYCPFLLAAAIVATIPAADLDTWVNNGDKFGGNMKIGQLHQTHLRAYLTHFFLRKLQKGLNLFRNALSAHLPTVDFSTDIDDLLGIEVNSNIDANVKVEDGHDTKKASWKLFFEGAVRKETLHIENNFYSTGTNSSVLSLCNGHILALQSSIDALLDDVLCEKGLLQQLTDIGYDLVSTTKRDDDTHMEDANGMEKNGTKQSLTKDTKPTSSSSTSSKNRKRNRSRTQSDGGGGGSSSGKKVSGIKLHIGNLAYTTRASDLYDYFTSKCGRENVLDCHIPIEKDTGRSRGFGFVTMPEKVALEILNSTVRHEIHGRMLKVAKSSSSGATPPINVDFCNGPPKRDRCSVCGYSPRYCTCKDKGGLSRDAPIPPMIPMHPPPPPVLALPPPDMMMNGQRHSHDRDYDRYRDAGPHRSIDRYRDAELYRMNDGPHRGDRRPYPDYDPYARDRDHAMRDRGLDRDRGSFDRDRYGVRGASYERSSSARMMPIPPIDKNGNRSHDRGEYYMNGDAPGYSSSSRRRDRHRSRSDSRGRSDRRLSRSRSHGRDRSLSRSRSRDRSRSRKRTSSSRRRRARSGSRSYSRSRSPNR